MCTLLQGQTVAGDLGLDLITIHSTETDQLRNMAGAIYHFTPL